MRVPRAVRKWFGLPSRIALMVGVGALSAAAGKADAAALGPEGSARVPQTSVKSFGALRVWHDGGRIFVAEAGGEAREVKLGDTPDANRLKQLLERDGATAAAPQVLQHRLILVGGGGAGFNWTPGAKPTEAGARPATGSDNRHPGAAAQPAPSHHTGAPGTAGTAADGQKG